MSEHSAQRLIADFRATRVSFTWFGVRKSLDAAQRAEAAETFGADGAFMSAGKKLLDTKHHAYRGVTAIKSQITSYWKDSTLPYPETGIRLIPEAKINVFDGQLQLYRAALAGAVRTLEGHYYELRQAARERLGRLFNSEDYPRSLDGLFGVTWEFPSVDPPDYLRELNPHLYEQERARLASRFDEAVHMAEAAFAEELTTMLGHLAERLSGSADGTPKMFKDTSVTNILGFFRRFRDLNISSNAQLDALVAEAEQLVEGVSPDSLRNTTDFLRQRFSSQLSGITARLDGLMVDRPRRNLIRKREQQPAATE